MSILSRLAASALALSAFAMSSPSYGTSYTTLYTFTAGTNGADPLGGLNIDSKGNLFGTAYGGVDWFQEAGTVFELSPVSNSLTPKYTEAALHAFFSFNGDGAYPYAGLVFDAAGNLYGTTCDGGPTGLGAIFRLNRPGNSITILHGFDDATEGHCPQAGLTFDSNGFLYGTVSRGGANGGGSLFKFNPASLKLTVLHSFAGPDGSEPVAGVVLDSAGSLYGTTYGGGANGAGTVYKFNQLTGGLTTLHSFKQYVDGALPRGTLVFDSKGTLYGTASAGGLNNEWGTIFSLNPSTGAFTNLHTLNGSEGAYPYSGLIFDSKGILYGTTSYGGANDRGTVYKFNPSTKIFTTLYSFTNTGPNSPVGSLVMDSKGNLFGTTSSGGGTSGAGSVFELVP